jgi:hypothetical protein
VLVAAAYHPNELPPLNAAVPDRYAVPPSARVAITYVGLPLDTVEDALQHAAAMQNARGVVVRKHQKMTGPP